MHEGHWSTGGIIPSQGSEWDTGWSVEVVNFGIADTRTDLPFPQLDDRSRERDTQNAGPMHEHIGPSYARKPLQLERGNFQCGDWCSCAVLAHEP